jgi:hypothetical protein
MSTVKVNTVDKRTGGTLTLGGCGTTVTLGAGATQSGFGRTGTVDWCTTAKTAPFTGVSGNGYFVNTTSGVVTVTLPATPSAGDIISIADYASTFQTNNVTLCRNSSKINGQCANASLSTQGQSITLVYVDGTRGWKNTMDSTSDITGAPNFILATGGTITCCGDYKIHTFTADGTFTVCTAPTPSNNNVSYMVVAGGGGGGGSIACTNGGAAGGAGGGFREYKNSCDPYTASPLNGNPGGTSVTVTATTYPISVGAGGAGGTACAGSNGANSIFSTITSAGGGKGGGRSCTPTSGNGGNGGSGGGAGYGAGPPAFGTAGTGNTPPTSPPQGNNGTPFSGGTPAIAKGGGSAGGTPTNQNGSDGVASSITGSSVYRSGAGGASNPAGSTGGNGGGGAGSFPGPTATSGTANTGGGGGGSAADSNPNPTTGGAGGSGIVIIRYKYQ